MQYLFTGPLFLARTKKRRVRRKTRNLRAKREGETFFFALLYRGELAASGLWHSRFRVA